MIANSAADSNSDVAGFCRFEASLCRLTPFVTVPMSYMDILSSSNRMKADIELTRFGRIMKTDLKRRRHMGGTWLLMLDRMEVSSLEDILTAPNLNNCFQAEDEDKGNGSSAQSNNAFTLQGCADENENEPVPTPVIETEEESKRRLDFVFELKRINTQNNSNVYTNGLLNSTNKDHFRVYQRFDLRELPA
ncbi:unnamed protein product, partial [Porites lobata]